MRRAAVKICGITSLGDAHAAIKCGAEYIGLIFVPSSRRCVTLDAARGIVKSVRERGECQIVCVFQNAEVEEVEHVLINLKPDLIQFHGFETPEYLSSFAPASLIKTVEIRPNEATEPKRIRQQIRRYEPVARHILFDRPKESASDKSWLAQAVPLLQRALEELAILGSLPYFFAGGLTFENVSLVVEKLSPFALDVASGVEASPGHKDEEKMNRFFQAVIQANSGASKRN